MMRWRTYARLGNTNGQPGIPLDRPEDTPHQQVKKHICGWCGGPRSHLSTTHVSTARVLCHLCMRAEFGGYQGYDSFIRSERARHRKKP
jgi:hypothetical protein